jgi:hypothetical protein
LAGPTRYGGLGVRGGGLGLMGLGASQQPMSWPFASMAKMALPYIAHLYTNGMQFKRTLGAATASTNLGLVSKPGLKMTLNAGYHPVTLDLSGAQPGANLVADPGFEASDTLADVQLSWASGTWGEWALMTTATDMRSGRRAMKCTRTTTAHNHNVIEGLVKFPVVPGQTYLASGWSKQNGGAQQSVIQVSWYTSQPVVISTDDVMAVQSGAKPWTYYSAQLVAPIGAAFALIQPGCGWWDGVTGVDCQTWYDDLRVVAGTDTADSVQLGDIIQLTEQGDPGSAILYTGLVEEIPDEISPDGVHHQITLTPLFAELGDAYFNKEYIVLTDVAQMVRDAVATTAHCWVQPWSVADSGVLAIYSFNGTNALEVLNVAKRIAGLNFWWFVDASGLVWFQSATTANPSKLTLKRGSDLNGVKKTRSIVGLKNFVKALGGWLSGATLPITSTYSNSASQKKYGLRASDPPLVFSTVTDQSTLDKIVTTVGQTFDREQTTAALAAPALGTRLTLGIPGGLTLRWLESANDEFAQPSSGSGTYSPNYIAQDIEVDGAGQTITTGDVPLSGLQDIQYELDRIVQRAALAGLVQQPFVGRP